MGIGKAPSIRAADTDVTPVKKKVYFFIIVEVILVKSFFLGHTLEIMRI